MATGLERVWGIVSKTAASVPPGESHCSASKASDAPENLPENSNWACYLKSSDTAMNTTELTQNFLPQRMSVLSQNRPEGQENAQQATRTLNCPGQERGGGAGKAGAGRKRAKKSETWWREGTGCSDPGSETGERKARGPRHPGAPKVGVLQRPRDGDIL